MGLQPDHAQPVVNLMRNFFLAIRVLRRERPDVVISTGAGVAVPFFFAGPACMGIPTIYVEVIDRVSSRTLTGRLCRPMSSAFCVQWPRASRAVPRIGGRGATSLSYTDYSPSLIRLRSEWLQEPGGPASASEVR